jgi:RHS repeat-associated protein
MKWSIHSGSLRIDLTLFRKRRYNFEYSKFNTHELDQTGLSYFNARYYDSDTGRFISPDPTIPNPTSTQHYNRYMFVTGNPISFQDASGYNEEEGTQQETVDDVTNDDKEAAKQNIESDTGIRPDPDAEETPDTRNWFEKMSDVASASWNTVEKDIDLLGAYLSGDEDRITRAQWESTMAKLDSLRVSNDAFGYYNTSILNKRDYEFIPYKPMTADDAYINSRYYRGWGELHGGLDFNIDGSGDLGEPINAIYSGTVVTSGWMGGYGYALVVRLDEGPYSGSYMTYGHLRVQSELEADDVISKGQEIGEVGNTGSSSGPHLHVDIGPNKSNRRSEQYNIDHLFSRSYQFGY